jgi:hypothetical protein
MLFVHIFIMANEQMYRISRLYPQISRRIQGMTAFRSLRLLVSQSVTGLSSKISLHKTQVPDQY